MFVRELAVTERPTARLASFGAQALSTAELLSIAVGFPDLSQAQACLHVTGGSVRKLATIGKREVRTLTTAQDAKMKAVVELSRRAQGEEFEMGTPIHSPKDVVLYFAPRMEDLPVEEFHVGFFAHLLAAERQYRTVRALAFDLAVCTSTLTSRFFRYELPSPKTIIAHVWLWRVMVRMEQCGMAFTTAATFEGAASGQSACRMVRVYFGCTPMTLWSALSADEFFRYFILDDLVTAHAAVWPRAEVLAA